MQPASGGECKRGGPSPALLNKIDTTEQRASFVQFHFIPYIPKIQWRSSAALQGMAQDRTWHTEKFSLIFLLWHKFC